MLIQELSVSVDFNGIVMFSYPDINSWFGGITSGDNILKPLIETDLGDKVMDEGIIVPIINIDDGDYLIRLFSGAPVQDEAEVVFQESGYPFRVSRDAFIADAAVLWDWEESLGWSRVAIDPGFYAVDVRGVRHANKGGGYSGGYDFILRKVEFLQKRTANTRSDSRVLP